MSENAYTPKPGDYVIVESDEQALKIGERLKAAGAGDFLGDEPDVFDNYNALLWVPRGCRGFDPYEADGLAVVFERVAERAGGNRLDPETLTPIGGSVAGERVLASGTVRISFNPDARLTRKEKAMKALKSLGRDVLEVFNEMGVWLVRGMGITFGVVLGLDILGKLFGGV